MRPRKIDAYGYSERRPVLSIQRWALDSKPVETLSRSAGMDAMPLHAVSGDTTAESRKAGVMATSSFRDGGCLEDARWTNVMLLTKRMQATADAEMTPTGVGSLRVRVRVVEQRDSVHFIFA
jgi:hypothetical protein